MQIFGKSLLKYTSIVVLLAGLIGALGYKASHSNQTFANVSEKPGIQPAISGKKAPGASCCKASFSRAKMLTGKNNHSRVTPSW